MKLLFVVNNPGFGGGNGQIVRLREPLAARGWEVVAVTPTGAEAAARLREGGVEVVELPLHRLRATPDPRVQAPFLARLAPEIGALRRLVAERAIDVVQAHGDTNPHAAIAGHRAGAAVVWQLYDTRTPVRLRRLTMPVVTRVADVITTWGRALGHAYPGTAGLRDRWIPVFPPVDGARFTTDPARRAAARAELGIPDGAVAVGAVGMLNPSKGFEYFVRALAAARAEGAGAQGARDASAGAHRAGAGAEGARDASAGAHRAGAGSGAPLVGRILGPPSPAHAAYGEAVREEARSLGLLEDGVLDIRDAGTRVAELMPGLDVLALSSVPRSEGMPTVILEAMACGLPVVATDVGAVAELVDDGVTGYVVAPEDPGALAARLRSLAADGELRERLGAAGRARFEREFSLDVLADTHARAYELALAHRRVRRAR